jgi:hypothetical protein
LYSPVAGQLHGPQLPSPFLRLCVQTSWSPSLYRAVGRLWPPAAGRGRRQYPMALLAASNHNYGILTPKVSPKFLILTLPDRHRKGKSEKNQSVFKSQCCSPAQRVAKCLRNDPLHTKPRWYLAPSVKRSSMKSACGASRGPQSLSGPRPTSQVSGEGVLKAIRGPTGLRTAPRNACRGR